MAVRASSSTHVFARCAGAVLCHAQVGPSLWRLQAGLGTPHPHRQYSSPAPGSEAAASDVETEGPRSAPESKPGPEPGPLARRLEEATEETLLTGGRAGRRAIEEAGFSQELKERLYAKVKDAQFGSEHAAAFAEASLPAAAGAGTRLTAASQPWTGEERTEDAVLRMLDDAHKPLRPELRGRIRLPDLQPIDSRIQRSANVSVGQRAASAREKVQVYKGLDMKGSDQAGDEEREARRRQFQERLMPAAKAMPNTLSGLAALANERIEDAIARGQFRNIPRGKGIERDTRADNPFIDTTEYLMNKMIKRQDMVPPWIEKQQDLVKAAHVFRARLRNEWKRHAARMIASRGGSVESQMQRAREYAEAEQRRNPRRRNADQIAVSTNATEDPVMLKMRQKPITGMDPEIGAAVDPDGNGKGEATCASDAPLPPPFRDPDWIKTEMAYMRLAVDNLNSLTRSYNLMAPELAKKPYLSLEHELDACFADVAPQLADEIKQRASTPARTPGLGGPDQRPRGILDLFRHEGPSVKVYDSKVPHYGLRQMWRDLFRREHS